MPLNPRVLRIWFAAIALAMVATVAGFYLYARHRVQSAIKDAPQKMGIDVKQSTEGFTLSKSEGGRTLFTISAKKAVQFNTGGQAELHDVNIVVYGRQSNRFDQIYGSEFSYNPQSGDVTAKGEVHIDLESDASGPVRPDQAPPKELKNPIHLKTSGVVFNQKTGFAATTQAIEFRVPQASGTAQGATYDSKNNVLTLQSAVRLKTTGPQGATITAQHGVITKEPRRGVLDVVHVERPSGSVDADHVTIFLRDDNSVERVLATGDVRATATHDVSIRAPQGEVFVGQKGINSAVLSGGVSFEQGGPAPAKGTAGRIQLNFGPKNELAEVRALDNVHISEQQRGARPETVEISAPTIIAKVSNGQAQKANTLGASQIVIRPLNVPAGRPTEADATTTITAGQFELAFAGNNRMQQLHGFPDAKIVSSLPGEPDKVSTSRDMTVSFDPKGGITSLLQVGDVHYTEGQRAATAQRARYLPNEGVLVLTGAPRISEQGLITSAQTIRFNRKSGDATAEGEVKTTYNEPRQTGRASGTMFSGSDPIHVTAASMTAKRATSTATYTGGARLWQGANIVQAPSITFDRDHRDVLAQGSAAAPVSTVFVQPDKNGKITPVNVTGARLTYSDSIRKARFESGVVIKGADLTVQADHADVFLAVRNPQKTASGASQVERIVAEGHVEISEPDRNARGDILTFTPSEGKFVLVGGPPSIFDAEHGSITGDSLTFYSRESRVVVGSSGSSRTVTQTRVPK